MTFSAAKFSNKRESNPFLIYKGLIFNYKMIISDIFL